MTALAFLCAAAFVVDGDTIRCGPERVRLLGIDSADKTSSSRCQPFPKPGAWCDNALYEAHKRSLRSAINGSVEVQPVTRDRYGRTVAVVTSGGVNLSCYQLDQGAAIYKAKWDNGRRVARACPGLAR